jgi:HD-GYP domain-containing protein (c-di-GMP phosphodiesterase class II)
MSITSSRYQQSDPRWSGRRTRSERIRQLISLIQANIPEVYEHGCRTAEYAVALGKAVHLSRADLLNLSYAAVLHDLGKLTLPRELLLKDGPLTAKEYELMQCHPRAGAELLSGIPFVRTPALWIAHHHERWDGAGYPYGIRGHFIPLGSRILAIADTYDSLTSIVSGRSAQSEGSALHLLRMVAGSQLDPELVKQFVDLGEHQRGSDVSRAVSS